MMTDFEIFEKNWKRAVNGLAGRITNDRKAFYSRKEINEMWREELITYRFCSVGIRDEAQVFLEELTERRPDKAKQLQDKLQASRLDVGVEIKPTAVKGVASLGATTVAANIWDSDMGSVPRVLGTVLAAGTAVCLAGGAVKGLVSGNRQVIIRDIRAKALEHLEEYRVLLEA